MVGNVKAEFNGNPTDFENPGLLPAEVAFGKIGARLCLCCKGGMWEDRRASLHEARTKLVLIT